MKSSKLSRRNFFKMSSLTGAGFALSPILTNEKIAKTLQEEDKPKTNIEDALKHPRRETSMPGNFPVKSFK
ncbi:MAG: twin-arginine translocation signal domain-containing protein [Melioribacteraceae bacterium]|nr:twin-arginine translocation signal domain-containing protein [Melioribacteraceae bacterium]